MLTSMVTGHLAGGHEDMIMLAGRESRHRPQYGRGAVHGPRLTRCAVRTRAPSRAHARHLIVIVSDSQCAVRSELLSTVGKLVNGGVCFVGNWLATFGVSCAAASRDPSRPNRTLLAAVSACTQGLS